MLENYHTDLVNYEYMTRLLSWNATIFRLYYKLQR